MGVELGFGVGISVAVGFGVSVCVAAGAPANSDASNRRGRGFGAATGRTQSGQQSYPNDEFAPHVPLAPHVLVSTAGSAGLASLMKNVISPNTPLVHLLQIESHGLKGQHRVYIPHDDAHRDLRRYRRVV